MDAAHRVLRYIKGTAHYGLAYTRTSDGNFLSSYADADWAACTDTRRSYPGYLLMLNGAANSWKSQQQKSVTNSTTEAEYVSASKASDEVLWVRRLLFDTDAPQTAPTPLYEDNRACRLLSENPIVSRARHIDFRAISLHERVKDGIVIVLDCPTHDMHADNLTKNLTAPSFIRHRGVHLGKLPASSPPFVVLRPLERGGVLRQPR
jgi:hypothetical protein